MLRTSFRSVRAAGGTPIRAAGSRQWHPSVASRSAALGQRFFADEKKITLDPSKPAVLPSSETTTSPSSSTPGPAGEARIAASTIPPKQVPLVPPTPGAASPSIGVAVPPPPPPPSPVKKKGFLRRLRNLILTISLLGALAFGGGIWYSRVNDNFHDFFTEYVPFGEQAVLYFEEMDFRKRLPQINRPKQRDTGASVKIPAQSGASWRVADSGEAGSRHSSALDKVEAAIKEAAKPSDEKKAGAKSDTSKPAPEVKKPAVTPKEVSSKPAPVPVAATLPDSTPAPPAATAKSTTPAFKPPEVDEPSRFPPIDPLDPINIKDAKNPVTQDLVKVLNDIITVINADNAQAKYGATVDKAKGELRQIGGKINDMAKAIEKQAAEEIRSKIDEFDKAATGLVDRVEKAMIAQESQWRQEFEGEMNKVRQSYDERVKLLMEREKQLGEEKLNNRLLEQAIALKKEFVKDVKSKIEEERDGRLSKLDSLSSAVGELEKLTTGWNDVVDGNLKTQQLHVAVEAVRASLQDAQHPRPFIRELVALKEIAVDDTVIIAAIASINPIAYQRGISTPAQIIDRFRRVAEEVRKASLLPEDAGVASHASSWLLSKVLFRKQGLAAGDDVESILTRTQTYLEEGDLDSAAREMNGLGGWAKTLSRDWIGEVRKVLEVQQALDVIATEARLQSLKVE